MEALLLIDLSFVFILEVSLLCLYCKITIVSSAYDRIVGNSKIATAFPAYRLSLDIKMPSGARHWFAYYLLFKAKV